MLSRPFTVNVLLYHRAICRNLHSTFDTCARRHPPSPRFGPDICRVSSSVEDRRLRPSAQPPSPPPPIPRTFFNQVCLMSVHSLISSSGNLDISCLPSLPSSSDSFSVLTALSAYGVNHAAVLDSVFGTNFSTASQEGVNMSLVEGDDSAMLAAAPHHLAMLSLEMLDGPKREREDRVEMGLRFGLGMADVVLFVVRMRDLGRRGASGIAKMAGGLRGDRDGKGLVVVVVSEWEEGIVERGEVVAGVLCEMQELWRGGGRVTEKWEFEFVMMGEEGLNKLNAMFVDAGGEDWVFEGGMYAGEEWSKLGEKMELVWKGVKGEGAEEVQREELEGTFGCDAVMRRVMGKFERCVRGWRREAEGGAVIEEFGKQAKKLREETIAIYETEAAEWKDSGAWKRKREELKEGIEIGLYELFVMQVARLREGVYREFKVGLEEIPEDDDAVGKKVSALVKQMRKKFEADAQKLRTGRGGWRYDNEMKELGAEMREDARERVQRAELAEYELRRERRGRRRMNRMMGGGGQNKRMPVQLSLHYLNVAPFGWKDSRFDKLSVDDDIMFQDKGGDGVAVRPQRGSMWNKRNDQFVYKDKK